MIEGELAFAGGLLSSEYLLISGWKIFLIAFLATLFTDWTLFFFGRYAGEFLKARFSGLENLGFYHSLERLTRSPSIAFTYRYLYGLRILALLLMGMNYGSVKKFLHYSFLSTLIWTMLIGFSTLFLKDIVVRLFDQLYMVIPFFIFIVIALVSLSRYNRQRLSDRA